MSTPTKDFFISYNHRDTAWAEWIAWVLEEAGYSVILQAWDFRPGSNFVVEMDHASKSSKRTVLVLSENYLESEFTLPEWAEAFARDPTGRHRSIVPFRVGPCDISGLLAQRVYVDLVGLSPSDAKKAVLGAFSERAKPKTSPAFPGNPRSGPAASTEGAAEPKPFPGTVNSESVSAKLDLCQEVTATVKRGRVSLNKRLDLLTRLSSLPAERFNLIVSAVAPPPGAVPAMPTRQADRARALFDWAESNDSCDLSALDELCERAAKSPTRNKAPAVFSLHGIRTRGQWQKETLGKELNENGFTHIALDYGFFLAIQLLIPGQRRKRIEWFRDAYTKHCQDGDPPPSVIAHSFGTYLVTSCLRLFPEIRFDRIILCGSIVHRKYPWSQILDNKQGQAVLNDYGRLDFWARIVEYGVSDAGPSGVHGFEDEAGGRVLQRHHPEFRHSDYFYDLNYRRNWIPFLLGNEPRALTAADRSPPNWKFRITMTVLLVLFVGAVLFGAWRFFPTSQKTYDITFTDYDTLYTAAQGDNARMRLLRDHVGKKVVWDVQILKTNDNSYAIAPANNTGMFFKYFAYFDKSNFDATLQPGSRATIEGTLDIKDSTTILTNCKIVKVISRS